MTLMNIGPLMVEVQPFNVHRYEERGRTSFARKAIVGSSDDLEHTGEGEATLDLEGQIFPQKFGGLSELNALEALRAAGVPQLVVMGSGENKGWFAILEVTKRSERLAPDGTGKVIEFTARLERTKPPSAAGFFAAMMGVI